MANSITPRHLRDWCSVPVADLVGHHHLKIPFRMCADSAEMGRLMARELVDAIQEARRAGHWFRAIIPCGPACWYEPFSRLVNAERVPLDALEVFHMDECLDWQGRPVPLRHPYSFRGFMQEHFYDPIDAALGVPESQRRWLTPYNVEEIAADLAEAPADLAYGGWGQDGHVAYNQSRRNPYSPLTIQELRDSTARVQDNNQDTIIALAQRTFGGAYQFVPPMSVTLGMKEILSARRIRLFSDTGAWKQTALRVALFGPVTVEYPITLLQAHPDALITATYETARHPISEHPEWDLSEER